MRTERRNEKKICVFVDPLGTRQLDPRGVAFFWPESGRGKGLLAVFDVCEIPSCPMRELLVWCVWISDDVCAVELEGKRRVTVYELPASLDATESRRARGPELFASIDLERWTIAPHPLHVPERGARRLLERLRDELDDELRDYLLETFESSRKQIDERHAQSLDGASGRPRLNVVPLGVPRGQLN